MRDFFHGWRRKLGCATMLLALFVVVVYLRGLVVTDEIVFEAFDQMWMISSGHGVICVWCCKSSQLPDMSMWWLTFPITPQNYHHALVTQIMSGHWAMSYWPLLAGLIAHSGYLIFWKPRKWGWLHIFLFVASASMVYAELGGTEHRPNEPFNCFGNLIHLQSEFFICEPLIAGAQVHPGRPVDNNPAKTCSRVRILSPHLHRCVMTDCDKH